MIEPMGLHSDSLRFDLTHPLSVHVQVFQAPVDVTLNMTVLQIRTQFFSSQNIK
jgi:hypothetical protein